MKKDLLIVGVGGHGRGVLEIAEAMNEDGPIWNILGFIDDDREKHGSTVSGYPVLGDRDWLQGQKAWVGVCLGSTSARRKLVHSLNESDNIKFATLIHPASTLSRRSEVGAGTTIFAGARIDTDTHIGRHVLVGRNAVIGHDIDIGDFVNIFPSASISGDSHIGDGCEIGTNATVIPGVRIESWSVVGAGAVVTSDLDANVTAVGMPAKVVKRRDTGWHLVMRDL